MEWPLNYHSKGRPRRSFFPTIRPWSLAYLALIVGFLNSSSVAADSSPPVADVEDLFKDEGFLRMSRGGEAFGRRPPPPPLILNPPHLSTQPPPRHFQTPSPHSKEKGGKPTGPPMSHRHAEQSTNQGDKKIHGSGLNNPNRNNSGDSESQTDGGGGPQMKLSGQQQNLPKTKPLEKDSSAVFSKVGSENSGASSIHSESESDAHPLLGITPAAPGDPFDFNPILSNPAVTRILAGSSGRLPMWEPSLPDLHDLMPEVNYTTTTGEGNNNRNHGNSYNANPGSGGGGPGSSGGHGRGPGTRVSQHDPKNPVFVPSPVSSNRSPTMYKEMNMDQLTNNIAIPKHTLPNPSNLATSRSTILEDGNDGYGNGGENGQSGGSRSEDRERDDRFSSNGGIGLHTHLEENRGGDGAGPYSYDEEESGPNEESGKNYLSSNGEAQGKRGIWKETGQDSVDSRDEIDTFRFFCDALCGAWKHQCKLMGILFSIAAVLCVVLAIAVLYSLHFRFRDFVPFSLILLFLFTTSASRAFILLTGSFCSPDSRPLWLPIVSTLPASLFSVTILVALQLARFPVPFVKTYTIRCHSVLILSLFILLPPLVISLSANFYPSNHTTMSQVAWIVGHVFLALIAIVYLLKFKAFYSRLSNERGASGISNGALNSCMSHNGTMSHASSMANGNNNLSSSLKKRGFFVKWGCLPARAMFGASILALSLAIMIIISVSMNRGECDDSSTWSGWVLSLCARMLEFAIVILLLLVTISSADIRLFRLSRTQLNKSNVGLMNADIYPTMVSSNTAVQRCIPMCSSNTRADVMTMGGPSERTSLRGKTFGERALPGERMGEYRSSVGRGLPLRLGNGPSHSLPGTPVDGFSQGLRLPEPAPASLLVTKVVFGTPAVSREVNLNHGHENPLLCTSGLGSKDDRDASNNIYASLESVKVASMANAGSSTGSNHSGSDRVLLSAGPRDYIYSISRDLTKTIDSIYDTSRPRMNNMGHTLASGPPLAHTIEQIGSIPNLNGGMGGRPPHFNFHQHNLHHGNGNMGPGRTDLARTIDRIRYSAATAPSTAVSTPTSNHPGRNFVLQLNGHGPNHLTGFANPPPYCSSESSHDVTPDSGIVSDIHSKSGRMDIPEVVYAREYRRNSSIEDIRRLPILPLPKQHRTPGSTPLYDRTPTSPTNPICVSNASNVTAPTIVGRVEHLLNQTEHILSRTESLDSNSHSAGLQRLLSHKEQLEHVERLLAQAEYAIWLEKRNCAQQVSQVSPTESSSPYSHGINANTNSVRSPTTASPFPSANSAKTPVPKDKSNSANNSTTPNSSLVVTTGSIGGNTSNNPSNLHGTPNGVGSGTSHFGKKISKNLEEESVV